MSVFSHLRTLIRLLRQVDLKQLGRLSEKMDLPAVMRQVSQLDDRQLAGLQRLLSTGREKSPPPVNSDFYDLAAQLSPEERHQQISVRTFMEREVRPIVNDYWRRAEFPMQLLPGLATLGVCGSAGTALNAVMQGVLAMEMARVDPSMATFFGVQSGLVMGTLERLGSEAQKNEWLPSLASLDKIGAFGLTEPEVGSGAAGGLTMRAKWNGQNWILNGRKKWIGNATFADLIIVWAQDEDDKQVKGFLVRKDNPGLKVAKMEDKMALRIVQNGLVTLTHCSVPENDRLPLANSFKDTALVLRATRAGVAWLAVGCAQGAYEAALAYCGERKQFGKPIAAYQLVQQHLVDMLSQLTAMQSMAMRLSQLQDLGGMRDEQASLAKLFCTEGARRVVRHAREVMGGNGILLEYNAARFMADAEAIYSYEGTYEINSLIVGRAITGFGAFV